MPPALSICGRTHGTKAIVGSECFDLQTFEIRLVLTDVFIELIKCPEVTALLSCLSLPLSFGLSQLNLGVSSGQIEQSSRN